MTCKQELFDKPIGEISHFPARWVESCLCSNRDAFRSRPSSFLPSVPCVLMVWLASGSWPVPGLSHWVTSDADALGIIADAVEMPLMLSLTLGKSYSLTVLCCICLSPNTEGTAIFCHPQGTLRLGLIRETAAMSENVLILDLTVFPCFFPVYSLCFLALAAFKAPFCDFEPIERHTSNHRFCLLATSLALSFPQGPGTFLLLCPQQLPHTRFHSH